MFCEKCGRPIDDGQSLCSDCATEETPVSPEETTTDIFELNTPANPGPEKKPSKKKKGLIAGITALVVAATAAVCLYFNVGNVTDTIEGFVGRTFQAPEEYLADVESDAITEYAGKLTNTYGAWLDVYNSSMTAPAANMELGLILGDEVLKYAESYLIQQGMTMDLDWLKNINLSVDAKMQESAMQLILGLGLGNTEILSADAILDLNSAMLYMGLPAINNTYLSADISSAFDLEYLQKMYTQGGELAGALATALPSEEELNTLIDTYINVVLSSIDNVSKDSKTVTIDGVSQEMVVLTAKITEKDLLNIGEKALKKAENDKTLKNVLDDLGSYVNTVNAMNSYTGYVETVDLYAEFQNAIPQMLESIKEAKEYADNSNYIKLNIYVDMQNHVRGHEANLYSDGEKMEESFRWLSVVDGDTVYTEAEFPGINITGEETTKKGVSEGEYVLYAEGQKVGALEFEDMTENSGTLRLIPSEELLDEALSGSGIPTAFLGGNVGLELTYNTDSLSVKLVAGSHDLVGLTLSASPATNSNITIPSDVITVIHEEDLMKWVQNMDLTGVLQALKDANVPTQIISAAESVAQMLAQQY